MVSGYGERGLSGPNSQKVIDDFKQVPDGFIIDKISRHYIAGDHEMGYELSWSWDQKGGMNERAIEMFESNFNELFFAMQEDQYKFIVLSSDLELLNDSGRMVTDKMMKKREYRKNFIKTQLARLIMMKKLF